MESLSDIVAQMRGRGEDGRMDRHLWNEYADRIEAAAKRVVVSKTETTTIGNAAALRSALEKVRFYLPYFLQYMRLHWEDAEAGGYYERILEVVNAALSAPARQCDVGTPGEQSERMEKAVCSKHHGCVRCPLRKAKYSDCSLVWAQTPYAEEGAGK